MDRGQWAKLARMPGLHPHSFSNDLLEFLMTAESQDFGLTSHPKDCVYCQVCVELNKEVEQGQSERYQSSHSVLFITSRSLSEWDI